MAWTTPITHATGDLSPASDWNTYIRDNTNFLYGDTAWTTVTVFTGTWAAGAQAPRFSKIGNLVTMQGLVQSGTINTAAFTLPTGYRPSLLLTFAASANGAFGAWTINTTGVVTPVTGATTAYSVACAFSVL